MCGNPVQEPTVVADHDGASGEVFQTVLQGADRVHVHIVRRLVQKQHVAFVLEGQRKVKPVPLASGKDSAEFLLI